jgi:hypothetical protein
LSKDLGSGEPRRRLWGCLCSPGRVIPQEELPLVRARCVACDVWLGAPTPSCVTD